MLLQLLGKWSEGPSLPLYIQIASKGGDWGSTRFLWLSVTENDFVGNTFSMILKPFRKVHQLTVIVGITC